MFPTLLWLFCSVNARTRPLVGTLGRFPVWINDWRTCNQNWISNFSLSVVKKIHSDVTLFNSEVADHVPAGWNRKCYWRIGTSPSDQSGSEGCFSSWTSRTTSSRWLHPRMLSQWKNDKQNGFRTSAFIWKQLLEKRTKDQEHKGHFLPRGGWLTPGMVPWWPSTVSAHGNPVIVTINCF